MDNYKGIIVLYYSVPNVPEKDKKAIIRFLVSIVVDDFRHSFDNSEYRVYMDKIKNINNADMERLYNSWLSALDYEISTFIKKSVKESYGGSRIFGLSTEEKNEFITDLRKAFKVY